MNISTLLNECILLETCELEWIFAYEHIEIELKQDQMILNYYDHDQFVESIITLKSDDLIKSLKRQRVKKRIIDKLF